MARPRFIRFRYTLRALLAFVTLLCLWGGYHSERSWRERKAEEVLKRHGASFQYGPVSGGESAWSSTVFAYQKLVQSVWRERFITTVCLGQPDDEVVEVACVLPHLRHLQLRPPHALTYPEEGDANPKLPLRGPRVPMPEGAVAKILEAHSLRHLVIKGWSLSDNDWAAIARHRTLEGLSITDTNVSEERFAEILALPRLEFIDCGRCDVTGQALAGRAGSLSLNELNGAHTPLGPEAASFLRRSHRLEALWLGHESIDDNFVLRISGHPSLKRASLVGTRLTDAGLVAVGRIPNLGSLTLPHEGITTAGLDALQRDCPGLSITHVATSAYRPSSP